MNQEVARLEELLARVQRNAALPRRSATTTVPRNPPGALASPPAAAFVAEPPIFQPAPAPFVPAAPAMPAVSENSPLDSAVDDLLLEDPFPLVPPAAESPYNELFEEEPIPLVSVSSHSVVQEDDISGVMTVSEFSDGQPEELLEGDIVELASQDAAVSVVTGHPLDELNFDDSELGGDQEATIEEPPASSSRSRVPGTMDEALARAAEQIQIEEGREVPLLTPPPESGPQAAMPLPPGIQAPFAPDLDDLLEAEIARPGGVHRAHPTSEQVGQTIELEEARGPSLELDHPAPFNPEPLDEELPTEELEVTLPGRVFVGGYQDDLMPPPEAREELDAHRQRQGEAAASPSELPARYPSSETASGGFAPAHVPSTMSTDLYRESVSMVTVDAPINAEFAPELLARPDISPGPVAKFIRVQAPRPNTFLELLDGSLSLGRD